MQQGWASLAALPWLLLASYSMISERHIVLVMGLWPSAQASIPEGAIIVAYALYSDKTHVENRRSRAVHPFSLFLLQGGIQITRKPTSVCRLGYAPVVQPRDLGIPDSLEKRDSKQKQL